jgi:predicted nucleotidyltransferase
MDKMKIEKVIVSKLKHINPNRIILFGSYAYGNPDKNSDLDICVIIDSSNSKLENKRLIRSLLSGIPIAKDILTPSTEEFNFYKHEFGSVYMEIDKKGKILWPNS